MAQSEARTRLGAMETSGLISEVFNKVVHIGICLSTLQLGDKHVHYGFGMSRHDV
jgi:hypothetical protein